MGKGRGWREYIRDVDGGGEFLINPGGIIEIKYAWGLEKKKQSR